MDEYENYALLGYYGGGTGRFFPETSVRNSHYTLRNNPEEHNSRILRGVWHFLWLSMNVWNIFQNNYLLCLKHRDKAANVRTMQQWGPISYTLLPSTHNKYYVFWESVCSFSYAECKTDAHIILLSVACLAVPYYSTFSHKRYDFRKKKNYWA